jgi:predicted nucleic acid-binding protein
MGKALERYMGMAPSVLDDMLVIAHRTSASRPIFGPDAAGVFPSLVLLNSLGLRKQLPPVVPDTNILRADVRRVCRLGSRTVLLNLANSGALCILCPAHVADEMYEHADEFSKGFGVDQFLGIWESDYLPLLRVVDEVPMSALTVVERQRVTVLETKDPDDVPAARLSLATGAFFLSNDGPALDAVYGKGSDRTRHREWVSTLKAGGNANELANLLEMVAMFGRLVAMPAGELAKRVGSSPAAALVAAAGAMIAYEASGPHRRKKVRSGVTAAMAGVVTSYDRWQSAIAEFSGAAAPAPTANDLKALTPDEKLLRAVLQEFGLSPRATLSASELHQKTRSGSETKVRALLRSNDCFFQASRGRFQLGRPYRLNDVAARFP